MKKSTIHEEQGEYKAGQFKLDGHLYPMDPMSDDFTAALMGSFIAGKGKALAKAASSKALHKNASSSLNKPSLKSGAASKGAPLKKTRPIKENKPKRRHA